MDIDHEALEQRVRDWAFKWVDPVYNAVYQRKPDKARNLYEQMLEESKGVDFPEHVRESLDVHIKFLGFWLGWTAPQSTWTEESYREALEYFTVRRNHDRAEKERLRRLISIRIHADNSGFEALTGEELEAMIDKIGRISTDEQTWHIAATWAFTHRHLGIIERAFDHMLTNPSDRMGSAKWQRVNLMYQILTNKVKRMDVIKSIELFEIIPQLDEFEAIFLPELIKLDLFDDEIELLYSARKEMVIKNAASPRFERRTKSIRSGSKLD